MHKVIKLADIAEQIIKLGSLIDREKNTIEQKRLRSDQASLIRTRTLLPQYNATITDHTKRMAF